MQHYSPATFSSISGPKDTLKKASERIKTEYILTKT